MALLLYCNLYCSGFGPLVPRILIVIKQVKINQMCLAPSGFRTLTRGKKLFGRSLEPSDGSSLSASSFYVVVSTPPPYFGPALIEVRKSKVHPIKL